jgi:hypothetical protein
MMPVQKLKVKKMVFPLLKDILLGTNYHIGDVDGDGDIRYFYR